MSNILWQAPQSRIDASILRQFQKKYAPLSHDYDALHAWSLQRREEFWSNLWDFHGVKGNKGGKILENGDDLLKSRFFPNATLNFAQNLLVRNDHTPAMIFQAEDKEQGEMNWADLHANVSLMQQYLMAKGVKSGDRVAAMLSNRMEAVVAMLAVSSLGAIWSSCSPDFGEQGVLDRFTQIAPKVFICVNGYYYAGKTIDIVAKINTITAQLPSLEAVICLPVVHKTMPQKAKTWKEATKPFTAKPVIFTPMPFNAPLYILFSSGTTGVPKCIIHGIGGTLLQHIKEHALQNSTRSGDRVFYFTTLGWMMWNWLTSALSCGATLLLYDGSPFHPSETIVFDFVAKQEAQFFGTSAKFIDTCKKLDINVTKSHNLSAVRTIASTGSPLSAESFAYVYSNIKQDVHLASISGGTDIVACFVLGTDWKPVIAGEIQVAALGMAVDVWGDEGQSLRGEKGELVCTRSFPSQPIGFWNDESGAKYHAAYFARFPNVWCHGDFAEITPTGGMIIHGRSDATLNPGGVRIGTAEIYAQVEQIDAVVESLAIGQELDNDARIVLFVRLRDGVTLDDVLKTTIKTKIRVGASPRHVPAKIIAVSDIPRTKSGKITELAVREIVHGRKVKNVEALANPESLKLFEGLDELKY